MLNWHLSNMLIKITIILELLFKQGALPAE